MDRRATLGNLALKGGSQKAWDLPREAVAKPRLEAAGAGGGSGHKQSLPEETRATLIWLRSLYGLQHLQLTQKAENHATTMFLRVCRS